MASMRMEIRLLKAVSLLRDRSVKIIHVAEQCGFNHLGLFNACFKKRFGNTPSRWRKGASNGENLGSDLNAGLGTCPLRANGSCPWAPKTDGRVAATARETISTQLLSCSRGPDDLELRETLLRNIREANAQMKRDSKPGNGVAELSIDR